jgi:polyisoprenoid-binding protein YceI
VLDAEHYPFVEVRARRLGDTGQLRADITLHGTTRPYTVPATIELVPQGVVARGTLTLKQTDFGITPFSVLGGAMAVQDTLEIRFDLPARPAVPDAVR